MNKGDSPRAVRRAAVLLATLAGVMAVVAPSFAETPRGAGEGLRTGAKTYVSFSFSGGYADQVLAARVLARHGMTGTFYVSSSHIGDPAYLSRDDLRELVRDGNEIGGFTPGSSELTDPSVDQLRRAVCDDRATLSALGLPVTSLAYPEGRWSYAAQQAAQACGYNSGRALAGLRTVPGRCAACPVSESLPARNVFAIRTTSPGASVAQLKAAIMRAERQGGWLPIALLHVCDCPDFETSAMSVAQFERLVQWVADRAVTTAVATTDRVVGGSLKTPVGTPDADVVTAPVWSTLPQSAPAVRKGPQWHVGPIPVSQGQMLFAGLLIGLTVIVTFRTATRGQRHES